MTLQIIIHTSTAMHGHNNKLNTPCCNQIKPYHENLGGGICLGINAFESLFKFKRGNFLFKPSA